MKIKLFIGSAMFVCLSSVGSAFSLDFTGLVGTTLPPDPLVIFVPGYGNVTFESALSSNLIVEPVDGTPALAFDQGEAVRITFDGVDVTDISFGYAGVSISESFSVVPDIFDPNTFVATLNGTGNGAGITSITFNGNAIPEPSSALLGVIGASLLVLRRRR